MVVLLVLSYFSLLACDLKLGQSGTFGSCNCIEEADVGRSPAR